MNSLKDVSKVRIDILNEITKKEINNERSHLSLPRESLVRRLYESNENKIDASLYWKQQAELIQSVNFSI